jgi:guanylate kinase
MSTNEKKSKLIVISGPSGVGKSTITKQLVERTDAFLSLSTTTRPIGAGEVDGREYHFMSVDEFKEGIKNDSFLEYAEVFGNYYGSPSKPVKEMLDQGKTVILEVDIQGGLKAKKIYDDVIMIFILPPNQSDLESRMNGRGRGEDSETARKRLSQASHETATARQYYDHMVINADVERAVNEIIEIVK